MQMQGIEDNGKEDTSVGEWVHLRGSIPGPALVRPPGIQTVSKTNRFVGVVFRLDANCLDAIDVNIGRAVPTDRWPAAIFIGGTHWSPEWMTAKEVGRYHQNLGMDFYWRWRHGEFPDLMIVEGSHKPALYSVPKPAEVVE